MSLNDYKVLIIGCGNIAGGYDMLQPENALPLSHAKAFLKNGNFALTACVEPDVAKRKIFQRRWHVPHGFDSLKDSGLKMNNFDVISICSPTCFHSEDIEKALELKPKLIFCEKPITTNLQETKQVVAACARQNVLLAVNYSRRWSPEVIRLKSEIASGNWGAIRSVSAVYNKGILNNGSHMLDLLNDLIGRMHLTVVGQKINDFFEDDPSVDATLVSEQGVPIHLSCAHAQDYTFFELQIVAEKGVINMEDGGARWRFRHAQPSEELAGYTFLNSGDWLEPNGSYAMTGAVANLFDALNFGASLASTGSNSLEAQTLCEEIKNRATAISKERSMKEESL
jgi:predicted dehydrogenase